MFNRIRHAARVLSAPERDLFEEPDISFVEEKSPEINKISKFIAGMIEILVVSAIVGTATAFFSQNMPFQKTVGIGGLTAAVLVFLSLFYQHVLMRVHKRIEEHLKIRERIGPYFGRRITRVIQTIRG